MVGVKHLPGVKTRAVIIVDIFLGTKKEILRKE